MNHVKFSGIIINRPTLAQLEDGPIMSFALQVEEPERMIIRVDVQGEDTEDIFDSVGNGDSVMVEGWLRFARWTNKAGEHHKTYLVEAETVQFLS